MGKDNSEPKLTLCKLRRNSGISRRLFLSNTATLLITPYINPFPLNEQSDEPNTPSTDSVDLEHLLQSTGNLGSLGNLGTPGDRWESAAVITPNAPQSHSYNPEKGSPEGWTFTSIRNGHIELGSGKSYILADMEFDPLADRPFAGLVLHNGEPEKPNSFDQILFLNASRSGLTMAFYDRRRGTGQEAWVSRRGIIALQAGQQDKLHLKTGIEFSQDSRNVRIILPDGILNDPIDLEVKFPDNTSPRRLVSGIASSQGSTTTVNKLVVIRNQLVSA